MAGFVRKVNPRFRQRLGAWTKKTTEKGKKRIGVYEYVYEYGKGPYFYTYSYT